MTTKVTKKTEKPTAMARQSVEQVWLAGLGALAVAENEGSRLFRNLVKKGETFDKQSRARLQKAVDRTLERVTDARTATVGRIEDRFDDGVSAVLGRLGVPTKRDIAALTRRVETLTHAVEKKRIATPRKRAPRRTTPTETTTLA